MSDDLREKARAEVARNFGGCDPAELDQDVAFTIDLVMHNVVQPEMDRLRAEQIVSAIYAYREEEAPRPFALHRRTDETGVSGEGTVAYGVQFGDGTVVIRWLGEYASTVVWSSLDKAMHVHGHRGSTTVIWLAEHFADLAEVEAKAARAEQAEATIAALREMHLRTCNTRQAGLGPPDVSCWMCQTLGLYALDQPAKEGEPT